MQYDEQWIIAYAMALEAKAKGLIRNAWVTGTLIGLLASGIAGGPGHLPFILAASVGGLTLLVVGSFLASNAANRAAMLRLQAHTALCQLQIERNTRPR